MEPKHSLLLLPAEIRSEIFLLAVAGKLPVFFDFLPERVDPWCHYAGDLRLVGHVQPPLTQACRQLRNEVLPIFYGIDNQVIVDLTSTPNDESRGSWWEQLSQYKPHHTTLSNLTLRYDIDLYNIDVYDTARYIYFDLTAATTALPGPLKLEVRSDVSFDICFCDIGELLDRVNLAYTSFSQRTGPPEECPIIFMCAALERDFIRPLILSRGRHEHCGKCGRCRLSAKAGIPGFIRAQKDRRADEMYKHLFCSMSTNVPSETAAPLHEERDQARQSESQPGTGNAEKVQDSSVVGIAHITKKWPFKKARILEALKQSPPQT